MTEPIRVVGAKELRKALKQADGNLKDLSSVHRQIADVVHAEARDRAPVLSGALRSTLRPSGTTTQARVVAGGKPRGAFVQTRRRKDGSLRRNPNRPIVSVGYAAIVERRQGFIATSIRQTKPRWLRLYVAEVNRIAERVGNG